MDNSPSIQTLSWFAGCWQIQQGDSITLEYWMPLGGNTMVGMGRTVVGGKTVLVEYMLIEQKAEGVPLRVMQPGSKGIEFLLKSFGESSVTFESPTHGTPRRILYWLREDGSLSAKIEADNGESESFGFEPVAANK